MNHLPHLSRILCEPPASMIEGVDVLLFGRNFDGLDWRAQPFRSNQLVLSASVKIDAWKIFNHAVGPY